MRQLMKCPQGHQWEAVTTLPGETIRQEVPCPVCGELVHVALEARPTTPVSEETILCSVPGQPSVPDASPTQVLSQEKRDPVEQRLWADAPEGNEPEIKGYSILRELGRGGMGVVYLAHQEGLDRFVAVKMIGTGAEAGADELERFHREAAMLSRLQHPNLVYIYEVGQANGRPFIAMEFVDGGDLDDKLSGKPQPPLEAAQLAETLARAMHAAHQKGMVHRDLKPANVLLTSEGIPKITDFGLVLRKDSGGRKSQAGIIMGTPNYMSPEQARGEIDKIGSATDVYALGAMLYEFLTGRPPFMAETGWDTIEQVVSEEVLAPSELIPRIPRDLETICLKCLEKDPEKRYESAEALAEDLAHFQRNEPIRARTTGPIERLWKWTKRRPGAAGMIAVSATALIAFVAVGYAYYQELHKFSEINRHRVIHLSVTNGVNRLDGDDWFGALLWFTEALEKDLNDPAHAAVHRTRVASILRPGPRLAHLFFHEGPLRHVSFSHDGRFLVSASTDRTARIWDLKSGNAIGPPLRHRDALAQAWFSPDDRTVLTACADGTAQLWDVATGQSRIGPLRHGGAIDYVSFSPDGRRVLTAGETKQALVWSLEPEAKVVLLLSHPARILSAAFSTDGRWIVTTSEDHTAQVWDAATGKKASPPLKHDAAVTHAAFSPGSKCEWLATASQDRTARIWKVPGGEAGPPLQHSDTVDWVAFSADGAHLVTASDDDSAKLWKVPSGELLAQPLRHDSDVRRYASFHPDGRWVATCSDDNTARIWTVATGSLVMTRLYHHGTVHCTAFGPGGRLLATAGDDCTIRIWDLQSMQETFARHEHSPATVPSTASGVPASQELHGLTVRDRNHLEGKNPVTGELVSLTLRHPDLSDSATVQVTQADFSRDGHLLVTVLNGSMACVWDARTGEPRTPLLAHAGVVTCARFNPDGSRLVTCSTDNTARVWSVIDGQLVIPPLYHRGSVRDASFSPDGTQIATASHDRTARVWDTESGQPITPALKHGLAVVHASFNADGKTVKTRTADNAEHTWELREDTRPAEELAMLARILSGTRINAGAFWPLEPGQLRTAWKDLTTKYPDAVGVVQQAQSTVHQR